MWRSTGHDLSRGDPDHFGARIWRLEQFNVLSTKVPQALGWIEQTQGSSDLVALRVALKMQVAGRIRKRSSPIYIQHRRMAGIACCCHAAEPRTPRYSIRMVFHSP